MGKIRAWLLPGWWWRVERGCFIKGVECHTRKSALYPVGSGNFQPPSLHLGHKDIIRGCQCLAEIQLYYVYGTSLVFQSRSPSQKRK